MLASIIECLFCAHKKKKPAPVFTLTLFLVLMWSTSYMRRSAAANFLGILKTESSHRQIVIPEIKFEKNQPMTRIFPHYKNKRGTKELILSLNFERSC